MKSSKEDLRKRGMIEQSDIDKIMSLSYSKLMDLVNAKSPAERSAAIHLLSDKVSKKISYPLPRDIIARSLAKMDRSILPVLIEVLRSENETKISEVIDAIGFLVFYHQELATIETLNCLIDVMNIYSNNDVVIWKCVLCLSAFPVQKSIDILNCITDKGDNNLIIDEALRSLNLIRSTK